MHDAALSELTFAATSKSRMPFADIELDESIDAETSTGLTTLHETDDTLSMFAAASSIPPPASDENGDCENALIPNIFNYLFMMKLTFKFQFRPMKSLTHSKYIACHQLDMKLVHSICKWSHPKPMKQMVLVQ